MEGCASPLSAKAWDCRGGIPMKDRMMMDKRNSGKEHIWLMLLALSFSNFMAYCGYILSLTLAAYLILHIRNFYMNFEIQKI